MELDERPRSVPPAGLEDDRSYNATVTTPPQGADPAEVWVSIPVLGDGKHGPCRYQPVTGETPAGGDRCLVVRGDSVEEWWIVQFDQRDVMPADFAAQITALDTGLDALEAAHPGRELAGMVAGADGSITANPTGGWSASRTSVGTYRITFTQAFTDEPVITVTPNFGGAPAPAPRYLVVGSPPAVTAVDVIFNNAAGTAIDANFSFRVLGPA